LGLYRLNVTGIGAPTPSRGPAHGHLDIDKLAPAIKAALETVPKDALNLMAWKVNSLARGVNSWSMNTDTIGVYGSY
jgi:hypothetical protein